MAFDKLIKEFLFGSREGRISKAPSGTASSVGAQISEPSDLIDYVQRYPKPANCIRVLLVSARGEIIGDVCFERPPTVFSDLGQRVATYAHETAAAAFFVVEYGGDRTAASRDYSNGLAHDAFMASQNYDIALVDYLVAEDGGFHSLVFNKVI